MKTITFILTFFLISLSFSQTKQIAHKSHSGKNQDFIAKNYSDNFGIITPKIEEIILLKNNCIVEVPPYGKNDTVCDHPYFTGQYTLEEIKGFYRSNTKFTGFENKFYNDSIPKQTKPLEKKNSFYLIALFLFLGGNLFFIIYKRFVLIQKAAVIFIFSITTFLSFSQTKQIAHKSHSGKNQDFVAENYSDNFGEPPQIIESIKYLKNNCVLISYAYEGFYRPDSICDHPYFTGKYTLDEIKAFYPQKIEFINFEGKYFNDSIKKTIEKPKEKKNSYYFLALILFIGGNLFLFAFKPKVSNPKSGLFLFLFFLASTFFSFSQTKQIAHKSHSGKNQDFIANENDDNFGNTPDMYKLKFEPISTITSVKLLKNNCVVINKKYFIIDSKTNKETPKYLKDTLCNHPYFSGQYTFDQIKTFYLPDTKFYGFKNNFFNDSIPKQIEKPKEKKNSFYLMALIIFIGGNLVLFTIKSKVIKS